MEQDKHKRVDWVFKKLGMVEFDLALELDADEMKEYVEVALKKHGLEALEPTGVTAGGGWPEYKAIGSKNSIMSFLIQYFDGDKNEAMDFMDFFEYLEPTMED